MLRLRRQHRRAAELQPAYRAFRVGEFRRRLLPTLAAIAFMFPLFAAGHLLFPAWFPAIALRLIAAVIIIQGALAGLALRCPALRAQQAVALATVAVPLIASAPLMQWSSATGTVIVFFVGLLFPWNAREAVLGASVPLLLQAAALRRGMMPDLFASASLVLVVCLQALRERERQFSFLSAREADAARQELAGNLHFAARVHDGLISPAGQLGPLTLARCYQPLLELGGDYFKARLLDSQRAALFIADVTGHGIPSALMVNRINAEVELILAAGAEPGEAMARLNRFVIYHFAGTGMMMTALWLEFDLGRHELRWVNCGHPPPLLTGPTGAFAPLAGGSPPLGVLPALTLTRQRAALPAGGGLLLYTDGLLDVAEGKPPIAPAMVARWCGAWPVTAPAALFATLTGQSDRCRGGIRRDDLLLVLATWPDTDAPPPAQPRAQQIPGK